MLIHSIQTYCVGYFSLSLDLHSWVFCGFCVCVCVLFFSFLLLCLLMNSIQTRCISWLYILFCYLLEAFLGVFSSFVTVVVFVECLCLLFWDSGFCDTVPTPPPSPPSLNFLHSPPPTNTHTNLFLYPGNAPPHPPVCAPHILRRRSVA